MNETEVRAGKLLEAYTGGNFHQVRQEMQTHNILLSDVLAAYIKGDGSPFFIYPTSDDIYCLVRRLEYKHLINCPEPEPPKSIVLKDWLQEQGVNTDLFWINCRTENQRWDSPYAYTGNALMMLEREPKEWIDTAFCFDKALQRNPAIDWFHVGNKWVYAIEGIDPGQITTGWEGRHRQMTLTLNRNTKVTEMVQYAEDIKAKLISWQGRLYLYTSTGHAIEIKTEK